MNPLFPAKKDLHRKDELMGDATSLEASYFHFLQPCFTSQTRGLAQALAFQDCRILSTHLPKGLPSQLFKAMILQQAKSNVIFLRSQNGCFELCRQGIKRHLLSYH